MSGRNHNLGQEPKPYPMTQWRDRRERRRHSMRVRKRWLESLNWEPIPSEICEELRGQ